MTSVAPESPYTIAKALVVDDEEANRLILKKLLNKSGYEVVEAQNGEIAVKMFAKTRPDLVFMDVMMPCMDGYQATREIKALCKNDFVPVIFITALSKEEDLEKCIQAGGDDFLSKPFNLNEIKSKILSLERIRGLYRHVNELNQTLESDNNISQDVFNRAIFSKNIPIDSINSWFQSSEKFNNDIFLVASTPSNGINVLLAHFNVKGLASAVGALPCSEVFRSMTKKGFSAPDILNAINTKLIDILPAGIFMSAIFVSIDEQVKQLNICNMGLPSVFVLSNETNTIINKICPQQQYIGINTNIDTKNLFETHKIADEQRIILSGEGILNIESEKLGVLNEEKFENFVTNAIKSENLIESIKENITEFTNGQELHESISLIEIPCDQTLIPINNPVTEEINLQKDQKLTNSIIYNNDSIEFKLNINGKSLSKVDPVPTLINYLQDMANIDNHREALFTIFTELYVNALDHGILGLESSLKGSEEGFANYFTLKKDKLDSLKNGCITIKLVLQIHGKQNQLRISFEDSGPGFNYEKLNTNIQQSSNLFSGRGITLVGALCDNFEFHEPGNRASAIYSWISQ